MLRSDLRDPESPFWVAHVASRRFGTMHVIMELPFFDLGRSSKQKKRAIK